MSFKAFKEFVEQSATRCGVSFELKSVQKNFDGVITAVKGNVFLPDESGNMVSKEVLWNLKGQAMLFGEQFDFVNEVDMEEVAEDTPSLLEANA